jgi:signal transduction histidine kinase
MHTLVITVTDTGCGIPKDSMGLIFKKFQQIQAGTGFGIGLFTVARLADSLQGRIDLWSELGKGTRFALSIPVALVHNHSNLTARSGTYGR